MKKNKGTEAFQKAEAAYADHLFGKIHCRGCKHKKEGRSCAAFDWIPSDIITGRHKHKTPYPGDNGVQFEPIAKDHE
jgi:hypothetical protein